MLAQTGMAAARSRAFGSSRHLWAIGVILIVMTLLGCGLAVWDLHRQTIEQQRISVRNLGVVLAEQTSRYVQIVDLALEEVQSRAAALDVRTPDDLVREFGGEPTRTFLRERLKNLPQANAFFLLRIDGHSFVTTRSPPAVDIDFADRDYYRHFAEHDDLGPFISEPMRSRVARYTDNIPLASNQWA